MQAAYIGGLLDGVEMYCLKQALCLARAFVTGVRHAMLNQTKAEDSWTVRSSFEPVPVTGLTGGITSWPYGFCATAYAYPVQLVTGRLGNCSDQ